MTIIRYGCYVPSQALYLESEQSKHLVEMDKAATYKSHSRALYVAGGAFRNFPDIQIVTFTTTVSVMPDSAKATRSLSLQKLQALVTKLEKYGGDVERLSERDWQAYRKLEYLLPMLK